MRKTDEDAFELWFKYYPEKVQKAYATLQDTIARTTSTAAKMEKSFRKLSTTMRAAAQDAAAQTTDSLDEAYNKKIKDAQKEPTKETEPALAPEYNLTEVKSDMKFDWEEPKFTSMTEI